MIRRDKKKLSYESLLSFLNEIVKIGVPNNYHPTAPPFFHFGEIIAVDNYFLTLVDQKNRKILIPINTILELHTLEPESIKKYKRKKEGNHW